MSVSRRDFLATGPGAVALGATAALTPAPTSDGAGLQNVETDGQFAARLLASEKLLWSPAIQAEGYRSLERILATRVVKRGSVISPLNPSVQKTPDFAFEDQGRTTTLEEFLADEYIAGAMILRDGKVILERYRQGLTRCARWTSMSVVKSISSTLVGCAVGDRSIRELSDSVSLYVPELARSAYADVTVRDLLTMASGVEWNENYQDPESDVNVYESLIARRKRGGILDYIQTKPKAHSAGTQFHYSTADTYVLGQVLIRATGKRLADYLSEKIWAPMGAEADASMLLDSDGGGEVAGSSANAVLRDYARFGQFILDGGRTRNGIGLLPDGWVAEASTPSAPNYPKEIGGLGYGYQWWVNDEHSFSAIGFAGQLVYINPNAKLVIVLLSTVPAPFFMPAGKASATRRDAFIAKAIDVLQ